MKKKTFTGLLFFAFGILFCPGCSVYYKVSGIETVETVKPRKRFRPYNPRWDKQRKRTRKVQLSNKN